MKNVLELSGLCKTYPAFTLSDVSFSVGEGQIMGFIGRNGAGKTTTLKSVLGLVHPDGGSVRYFGMEFSEHEAEVKPLVGYAGGTVAWYPRKKIREIARVSARFYKTWDDAAFSRYCDLFRLDPEKCPCQLSEGMKVKFNLALALSHGAKLLILDEPTSGLDPVSREELLDVFLTLRGEGVAVLFSTHITSDLEKCADAVTYIKGGKILFSRPIDDVYAAFAVTDGEGLSDTQEAAVIGRTRTKNGSRVLIGAEDAELFSDRELLTPTLEEIMVHLEKEA